MNEITDLQKRRAENLIWNGAGDYSFSPDFKAYDDAGLADVYWNIIIGSARRHYEYGKFQELFKGLDDECIDIFWTALEDCLYEKEVTGRPVLEKLKDKKHFSELKFNPDMSTDEIVEEALRYFALNYNPKKGEKKKRNLIGVRKNQGSTPYHKFLKGSLWRTTDNYASHSGGFKEDDEVKTKMSAGELRDFMETKFGKSTLSAAKTAELEKNLCRDSHAMCHLLVTDGEKCSLSEIENGFEALTRQKETAQIEQNRKFYKDNEARNRMAINSLAGNIQNSMLLHLQPSPVKSNTGSLVGGRVWRGINLDDPKVFEKSENDNMGDLLVEIMLDASTSQKNRLATISSQAYIIAEALKKCSIPCRVASFCSMTGYTVIRNFRKNEDIFEYVANGCNRDGLGIRTAHHFMNLEGYEHKILIVLSDVKPNDIIKIKKGRDEKMVPYDAKEGLNDTALEVRRARSDDIAVICIFTGEDEDLPSAKMVYNRDFVRIQSFDMLAETVGKLIQNQIKNL